MPSEELILGMGRSRHVAHHQRKMREMVGNALLLPTLLGYSENDTNYCLGFTWERCYTIWALYAGLFRRRFLSSMIKALYWIIGLLEWPLRHRQLKLMKSRSSYSRTQFIKDFDNCDVEREVAIKVWDALIKEAIVDDFKPKPEDSLLDVFGLADEDLDDMILNLLTHFHCKILFEHEMKTMLPVDTVRDLVRFISIIKAR